MIPYRLRSRFEKTQRALTTMRGMMHWDRCDPAYSVLLAGSGRSGTTWLGQIINHSNTYRDVFEPLSPLHVDAMRGQRPYRYLPPNDTGDPYGERAKAMLSGQVRCSWTDGRNRKLIVKQRLVKAIRANLLLGWVHQQMPQTKLLYAMRHPCAVIHSRIKLGWATHLNELLDQPALMHDHLDPYRETIERAQQSGDPWQQQAVMWSIENVVPLRQLQRDEIHVLFYERFCTDFDREVADLFNTLGQPIKPTIERARRQTSAHFRRDSAVMKGGDLISDWQQHVSTKQIDLMLSTLHRFGLDHLYNDSALPLCDHEHVFMDSARATQPTLSQRDAA